MKEYFLKPVKAATDAHGQTVRLFKANFENNVSKAIDQLSGICAGILADGEVNEAEAKFFAEWVQRYAPLEPIWPFTDVLSRVERIFSDGICDSDEREELKGVMQSLCGIREDMKPCENYSSTLPLDAPEPKQLIFPNRNYVITGRFAFGTRVKVLEAIEQLGGIPSDGKPNRDSNYLVIGIFASRDWINTNYGRKIEHAVELRSSGTGISIISEEHWRKFVA